MPHPIACSSRVRRLALALSLLLGASPLALAQDRAGTPPRLSVPAPDAGLRVHPLPRSDAAARSGSSPSGSWWFGPTGVVLALAAFGGLSYALRRPAAGGSVDSLQVIGRVAVAPRQSVVLLRAGDRVLLLGVGGQGPPSLLGELEEEPLASVAPAPAPSPGSSDRLASRPAAMPTATVRLGEVTR